jgi:protein phosphatase-4 regulatory subunit 3
VTQNFLFGPILDIVFETMPRDNLLNSACLELFEFIKRENLKPIITHIVDNYRKKLEQITYVGLFQELILRYDQMQGYNPEMEGTLFGQEEDSTPARTRINGAQRWQGVRELDPAEEEYFNTSDDEDELAAKPKVVQPTSNGASPLAKALVDYPDDDDEPTDIKFGDDLDPKPVDSADNAPINAPPSTPSPRTAPIPQTPPERLSEKRRREEDEEDELGKLSSGAKRRSSSISSVSSTNSNTPNYLRRKKSFTSAKDPNGGKRIAISLALKNPIETEHGGDDGG